MIEVLVIVHKDEPVEIYVANNYEPVDVDVVVVDTNMRKIHRPETKLAHRFDLGEMTADFIYANFEDEEDNS